MKRINIHLAGCSFGATPSLILRNIWCTEWKLQSIKEDTVKHLYTNRSSRERKTKRRIQETNQSDLEQDYLRSQGASKYRKVKCYPYIPNTEALHILQWVTSRNKQKEGAGGILLVLVRNTNLLPIMLNHQIDSSDLYFTERIVIRTMELLPPKMEHKRM